MSAPTCSHEAITEVDARQVCDRCGEVLSRDEALRRRRLERVREVRRSLHPTDGSDR